MRVVPILQSIVLLPLATIVTTSTTTITATFLYATQTLCTTRAVPDVEFFINKRDFPQLKRNVSEPYDFIYDQDNVPLDREKYTSYAPIASFFVGNDFADVPFVTTDDWETATGR